MRTLTPVQLKSPRYGHHSTDLSLCDATKLSVECKNDRTNRLCMRELGHSSIQVSSGLGP